MAGAKEEEFGLHVDESMLRNTTYSFEGDFKKYRQLVSISQGIKILKQQKPAHYKKTVGIYAVGVVNLRNLVGLLFKN